MAGEGSARPVHLGGIETLRGLAAALVVAYHASRIMADHFGGLPLGGILEPGHSGVDVFFVLSGFVISYAHWDDRGNPGALGRYAWRRLSRIYPPYWVATAIMLALYLVSPSRTGHETELAVVVQSLLLYPVPGGMVLGVAWSLVHELTFYVLFAVLVLDRRLGTAVLGLWLVAALGGLGTGAPLPGLAAVSDPYHVQFFLGMAAAWALRRRIPIRPGLLLGTGVLAFAAVYLAELAGTGDPRGGAYRLAYGLAAAALILGAAAGDRAGSWRIPRPLLLLGSASYSVYLVHVPVILVLSKSAQVLGLGALVPVPLLLAAITGAAILSGIAFSALVEMPLLRLCRRLGGPRRQLAPAAPGSAGSDAASAAAHAA
jgi:peptidoglycan/LPS O-acetylase OafA/YrhL